MRKRNHVIPLHLNAKEMKHLDTQVGVSGWNFCARSSWVRSRLQIILEHAG